MSTRVQTIPVARPRRRLRRKLGLIALVMFGIFAGLGVASHVFPAFGAALADGVRSVAGPGVVAWAEDVTYGIEDRVKRFLYRDAPPKQFWDEPAPPVAAPAPAVTAPEVAVPAPVFAPASFHPPVAKVAGKHDGEWIAVPNPDDPGATPVFYKALVHPDKARSFAAVAVVAIDLAHVALTLVPGTVEPASSALPRAKRPGVVPPDAFADLLAAFNGGFKAEHGHFGMMLDGVTLLPPRDTSCTIGLYKDGSLQIHTYPALKDGDLRAYRQTPPCLVEDGAINHRASEHATGWGAAVGGDTVIRRSALGLSADGAILFYGLGESVTADSLARAMLAAGAHDAAQLDVNAAYPRFLFYQHPASEPPRVDSALIPDIDFSKHEYVGQAETRDFFFLTRKAPSAVDDRKPPAAPAAAPSP